MNNSILFPLLAIFSIVFLSCNDSTNRVENAGSTETLSEDELNNFPEWAKDAALYEVNLRQYTPEGTINAFMEHLPRLKDLGVDILWFMPVHPISETKRKGTLGSPYAVSNYRAINPEFGTMDDFKNLMSETHDLGMKVIIDWVPNFSGWDHTWLTDHPEYYTKIDGEITDPINPKTNKSYGWTDVAELNYENHALRKAMIEEMNFWIKKVGVDGFRVSMAYGVPNDFWDEVAENIYRDRPVFLLAESEAQYHTNSGDFISTYALKFSNLMIEIAKGEKNASAIDDYLKSDRMNFKKGFHVYFTANHDENATKGSVFARLGEGHKTFAVLAATLDGMPLIYGGQEAPLERKLAFFEKDSIDWNNFEYADFYKTLLDLKKRNRALWNGKYGGEIVRIPTGKDADVYAFTREKNGDKIVVILNLSNNPQEVQLSSEDCAGTYTNVFANGTMTIDENTQMTLNPWDYIVLSNK